MTEPEKANQALRDFDAETNAYCVARGEQRLALVQAYHKAKEAKEAKEAEETQQQEAAPVAGDEHKGNEDAVTDSKT